RAVAGPPCGHSACSDAVAATGLRGGPRSSCFKEAKTKCEAGTCSCTDGPACVCVALADGSGCDCEPGTGGTTSTTTVVTTSTTTTTSGGGCNCCGSLPSLFSFETSNGGCGTNPPGSISPARCVQGSNNGTVCTTDAECTGGGVCRGALICSG